MVSHYLLLLAALCAAVVASHQVQRSSISENLSDQQKVIKDANELADEVVQKINSFMLTKGRDSIELPNDVNKFKWGVFSGELSYTKGWLQGLATLERRSDASIATDGDFTVLTMPLRYPLWKFGYDYVAKFTNLGPSGGIEGRIIDTDFDIKLRVDAQSQVSLDLDHWNFNTLGSTSVKFTGNSLTDWLVNLFSKVTVPFLKPIIRETAVPIFRQSLLEFIKEYNESI